MNTIKLLKSNIVCFCLITGLSACTFFSNQIPLVICLPDPPMHWIQAFGEISYILSFPNPSCGIIENHVIESSQKNMEISLTKQNNMPVLAYPTVKGGQIILPPAGALFPLHLDDNGSRLILSWEHGPLSGILFSLISQGFDVSTINTVRLADEIISRACGDPWRIDQLHIGEKLCEGRFRVNYISLMPFRDIQIFPGQGIWFLESPFAVPQQIEQGQELILKSLSLGFHRLFNLETDSFYSIYLDDESVLFIRP